MSDELTGKTFQLNEVKDFEKCEMRKLKSFNLK